MKLAKSIFAIMFIGSILVGCTDAQSNGSKPKTENYSNPSQNTPSNPGGNSSSKPPAKGNNGELGDGKDYNDTMKDIVQ